MGMGEDQLIRPYSTRNITLNLLSYLIPANNLALGLDGVDIATVLPKIKNSWILEFTHLNKYLEDFNMNPNNIKTVNASNAYTMGTERSRLRLFYSLHSAIQEERDLIIPNALPLIDAHEQLNAFNQESGCNIIFHHMFMDGQNDSDRSVDALLEFMAKNKQHELRILRYNSCTYTPFGESPKFDEIITKISKEIPRLKVQISVGSEVQAACGQFIVKSWADPNS